VMGLPYPGGPLIDQLAAQGNPTAFKFAKPQVPELNYSFSGLKTSFLYFLRERVAENPNLIEENMPDLCASIQHTIIAVLMDKLLKAVKLTGIREIAVAGGVSANSGLRNTLVEVGKKRGWTVFIPEFGYTTDNAAMIGIAGYFHYMNGERATLDVAPVTRIKL